MDKANLTASRLRELLNYDPATGVFKRRLAMKGRCVGSLSGAAGARGRRRIAVDGRLYLAARLAWLYVTGEHPTHQIDHIDGDCSNDRFGNLRDVPGQVNAQNIRQPRKAGGVLGVRVMRGRFQAYIRDKGRQIVLGVYDSSETAHAVYVAAKRQLHEGCTL